MMGKTTGRWTKEEHKKFVCGKLYLNIKLCFSTQKLWKRLETCRGLRANKIRGLDPLPCPEVLHQDLEKTEGQLCRVP